MWQLCLFPGPVFSIENRAMYSNASSPGACLLVVKTDKIILKKYHMEKRD